MENLIKERPILFSAPMVRALLDGSKTQTRRIVKGMAIDWLENAKFTPEYVADPDNSMCPYGKVGDRLWVRETILQSLKSAQMPCGEYESYWAREKVEYFADTPAPIERFLNPNQIGSAWMCKRPSIHMPRWASRITLEITNVRVERLQDISESDACAEGIECEPCDQTVCFKNYMADNWIPAWGDTLDTAAILSFESLWESINGSGSWQENPWVWVVEFKRI